eukprot:6176093-Pleurochrysis_carterae.AAC.1
MECSNDALVPPTLKPQDCVSKCFAAGVERTPSCAHSGLCALGAKEERRAAVEVVRVGSLVQPAIEPSEADGAAAGRRSSARNKTAVPAAAVAASPVAAPAPSGSERGGAIRGTESGIPKGLVSYGKSKLDGCSRSNLLLALKENGIDALPPAVLNDEQQGLWARNELWRK